MDFLGNYKMNPHYGNGIFRRRIHLSRETDHVHAQLEDSHHGFQVKLFHQANRVSRFEPSFLRVPFTSCSSAGEPLDKLLGAALDSSVGELVALAQPLTNCTHLLDLSLLAIAHTQREEKIVQYDVEVTDAKDGVARMRVWRNDVLMHEWQSNVGSILSPEPLAGKTLFAGFSLWANTHFSGLDNEAAFVLQKGNLVSIGNMVDVSAMAGGRASDETDRNACHTYSPANAPTAIRLGNTTRDFTHAPEQLLRFV